MKLGELKVPFPAEDIDWRVQSAGTTNGKVWAKCLAYMDSRAVYDRLDDVCGPEGWQSKIEHTEGGFIASIGIRVGDEWVWKSDGAQTTDIEAVKGGISGAFKRAATHWGIGRYLYNLKVSYADVQANGVNYQRKDSKGKYEAFKWNPPKLPKWALPEGHTNAEYEAPKEDEKAPQEGSEEATEEIKAIGHVLSDIRHCKSIPHLENIYKKYKVIFSGEDYHALTDLTTIRKGELG